MRSEHNLEVEFMKAFTETLIRIDGFVWGTPMIVAIFGVGILLSFRLGFLQFRRLGKALKYMTNNEVGGEGEVSSFQALTTALAATVGTGNIVGVATAIVAGGPGALFWMEIAAIFGMATKYAEGLLAVKYRVMDDNGHAIGGPFYYIENGLGKKWIPLAKAFALFAAIAAAFGPGTITQVNSITQAINNVFDPKAANIALTIGKSQYTWTTIICAVVITTLVALIIIGGIQRIASVASFLVPSMMVLYVVTVTAMIIYNINALPGAIVTIVKSAFGIKAMGGGALGAMMVAMQKGVARGIFSNEAGLGSAPIAAAAAQTREPARQGLVSMTGTFLDTIVICTMTGLSIVLTGSYDVGLDGADVTIRAFGVALPWSQQVGAVVLMTCLTIFAFTTILGWNYYGERSMEYLTGGSLKAVKVYRYIYIIAVFAAPFLTLEFIWTAADIFNALMAIPNLIALIALSGVVASTTKDYFHRLDSGLVDEGPAFNKNKKKKRA